MSFFGTVRTVLWSFVGIRKRSGFEEDLARVKPFHVIGVALAIVGMLVVGLIVLVNWVVKH
jgi:hypothetical protein